MATIGGTYMTLLDWANFQKPEGGVADIIEVAAVSNPILQDAYVLEGNLPTGHRSTQRASLPSGSWRLLNQGVAAEKTTVKSVTDNCGILEDYSVVDELEMGLNGNRASYRAAIDSGFVAGLSSTAATALFYGNQNQNPEQIHGLAPRYNSTTGSYASQIITGGGTGSDNTSIWRVTWGPQTCAIIFPKGMKGGLQTKDLGVETQVDSTGRRFRAYVTQFQWHLGLALTDYRWVIRICNIDSSDLSKDASTGADLLDKMLDAHYAVPTAGLNKKTAKTFWYCNKRVATFLHKQVQNKANVHLTVDSPAGEPVVSFLGVPVHICDNITIAEDLVS